jgi:hypothetical protein
LRRARHRPTVAAPSRERHYTNGARDKSLPQATARKMLRDCVRSPRDGRLCKLF